MPAPPAPAAAALGGWHGRWRKANQRQGELGRRVLNNRARECVGYDAGAQGRASAGVARTHEHVRVAAAAPTGA